MSLPGPIEAAAIALAAEAFERWKRHAPGELIAFSRASADKASFQAGFVTAVKDMLQSRKDGILEWPQQ